MKFEKILRGFLRETAYHGNALNLRALRRVLNRENPIVFEIGAADGLDTSSLLTLGLNSKSQLHVFEPDPRFSERHMAMSAKLGYFFNNVALGDFTGNTRFHQSSTPYSSSLKTPNLVEINAEWPEIKFDRIIEVEVQTLDGYCASQGINLIDFIWADVQGGELELIRGGTRSLRSTRYLYTEFSTREYYCGAPDLAEVRKALGSNWELVRNFGSDALFYNHSVG